MATTPANPWKPLLDGELRVRSLAVVDEIITALQGRSIEQVTDCSLASGHAGLAVAFAYFHRSDADCGYDDAAGSHINAAIDRLAAAPLPPGLHGGFSGIAWAASHLDRMVGRSADADDEFAPIDAALLELLAVSNWDRDYDLISGLAGIGVYALERLPNPNARECLARVVDQLARLSEELPDGVAWRTPTYLMPPNRRPLRPDGEFNLGVAHGVPGAIAILAQAFAADIAAETAAGLIDRAIPWLLKQRLADSPHAQFSYDAGPGELLGPSRSAWCYGDPGVALALFCAARARGNAEWERAAIEIALAAAVRPEPDMQVADAGLCHGWAGLLHQYNRLYQATGEEKFADFARHCCLRTLEAQHPGRGIAGYAAWQGGGSDGKWDWLSEVGMLEGAAGIALALSAAATGVAPDWDLTFLISNRTLR